MDSWCIVCDAPIGACTHAGPRYLDAVVYEKVPEGWRVPDGDERERFENPPPLALGGAPTPPTTAREVQKLIVEAEAFVDMSPSLESLLRSTYELNPVRVTRLMDSFLEAVKAGKLSSPGGFLVSRLRQMATA